MGYIEPTGDNHSDIGVIMEQLNLLNNAANTTGQLNVATYGVIGISYPGNASGAFQNLVAHNLGYPPVFLTRNIVLGGPNGTDITYIEDGFEVAYTYTTGPKSTGFYPSGTFLFFVDKNNIYVKFNVPSPTVRPSPGDFYFQYFLFSSPIGQKS